MKKLHYCLGSSAIRATITVFNFAAQSIEDINHFTLFAGSLWWYYLFKAQLLLFSSLLHSNLESTDL